MRRTAIGLAAVAAAVISMVAGDGSFAQVAGRPAVVVAPQFAAHLRPATQRATAAATRPPLVIVIFDALSPWMLQTPSGEIDAVRYPNFAAFANGATWYRNATTISESTRFSIPAILDGRYPHPGQKENWLGHPFSIFKALGGHYRINDREDASRVCPPPLCHLPAGGSVITRLSHGRVGRFRTTLRRISAGSTPQLTVLHTLITHEPRQYLPDGRRYQLAGGLDLALDGTGSYHRRFLTEQAEQRTVLQLQYADRLLGELVERLKRTGVWDQAAVALISDHGESFAVKRTPAKPFQIGKLTFRRAVTRANVDRIAGVALFVKYPNQRSGDVDQRFVRTIDLTPTLLGLSTVNVPWSMDGRSLLAPGYRGQTKVAVRRQEGGAVTIDAQTWVKRAAKVRDDRIARLGSGEDDLFAFGPRRDLYGHAVSEFQQLPPSSLRASVFDAAQFSNVHGDFVPAHVAGRLSGAPAGGRVLALALGGTIVSTVPTYPPLGKIRFSYSAMLPPSAFLPGRNKLEIFEVVGNALRPLGGAG